jgi:hypothetical protein
MVLRRYLPFGGMPERHDLINAVARLPPKMAYGKTVFHHQVAAIAIIVLSVAVLAYIGFAIWSEP